MADICKYVIVDAQDVSEDYEYDTLAEAEETAAKRDEPVAIIERTYTFEDSELVWTSTGHDVWPPPKTGTCRHCGGDIEFDIGNQPPWTHTDTGVSDCPADEAEGFHAEPTTP